MDKERAQISANEWVRTCKQLEEQKHEVYRTEVTLKNIEAALGGVLVPDDAKINEKFSVWVLFEDDVERLVEAELLTNDGMEFHIRIRE